jgi:integrase
MASSPRWVERWLNSKIARNCVPTTLQQYRWVVDRALAALHSEGRPTNPQRWAIDDGHWLRQRFGTDPWFLRVLADLAKFCGNRVFQEVGLPRTRPPTRVRWLTAETAQAIVRATRDDPRLRLVALLGLAQGLRRVEWVRLQVSDVDLTADRLLVRGKGRGEPKLAWMPLHPSLPGALRAFLMFREAQVERYRRVHRAGPVPPEMFIHPVHGVLRPYTVSGADRWVRMIGRRLHAIGIPDRLSSHMFRRSAATFLERTLLDSPEASRDGVYRAVQGFLRHENLATTMKYLEADPSRERRTMAVFGAAFPLAVEGDGEDVRRADPLGPADSPFPAGSLASRRFRPRPELRGPRSS